MNRTDELQWQETDRGDEMDVRSPVTPVSREWLRNSNKLAKRIPRKGYVTPEAELAIAAAEYSKAAHQLGMDIDPASIDRMRADFGAPGRPSGMSFEALRWDRKHEALFAAGRTLEVAIQVARFGKVIPAAEMLALGDEWKAANV
jgi:hypothetical protein